MATCPHCEKAVELLDHRSNSPDAIRRKSVGTVKKEVMYSCPHCGKVLGFSYFFGGLWTGRP